MEYTEWHLGDVRAFGGYFIYDEQGRLVAECPTVQGVDKLANAHLIAAAPDLYEALNTFLQNVQPHYTEGTPEAYLISKLYEAIAKVEGG